MNICVVGAGAIGGHLIARLAAGGAEPSVLARGATLAALRRDGLRVNAPDGLLHCRPRAEGDAATLGPQDAVVLCTKVTAYPQIAPALAPLLGPETVVACVANGIPWWYFDDRTVPEADPDGAMARVVGRARVLGGVVYSACAVTAPAVVEVVNRNSRLILGEPNGSRSDRAVALAGAFKAGGLGCSVSADIRGDVWAKLVNNLNNGPICLLTRQDAATSLADPAIRAAAIRLVEEAMAIAAAYGHTVAGSAEERIAQSSGLAHKPSILQDLEAGRPTEFAPLFDVPLRLAREVGVPMPTLALLLALARQAMQP